MKFNEQVEKILEDMVKIRPASLAKMINDALIKIGYKVDSRETTPGAIKTWLNRTDTAEKKIEKIADFIAKELKVKVTVEKSSSYSPSGIRGPGFEIEIGDEDIGSDLFVAVYAGPRANEYRHGLDV